MLDIELFTPLSSLAGGGLIGLSAGLLFVVSGRVAGISGILGGFFGLRTESLGWRIAFLLGLLCAPAAWKYLGGRALPAFRLEIGTPLGWLSLVAAGLLVGFGTRMARGCTSGHGVCGLSRLSPRSLMAVLVFMGSGMATVYLSRHVMGA